MKKSIALAVAMAALLSGKAVAQEATDPKSDPKAMQFKVSPSGFEAQNEEVARQERLLKRMEQADYAVRSICVNCGDSWKHQTYAPFDPLRSLRTQPSPEEQ